MSNTGSLIQVGTGRPDTTQGLWHRLDYKYPFTMFLFKALSCLPALTIANALICGAVLYGEYKNITVFDFMACEDPNVPGWRNKQEVFKPSHTAPWALCYLGYSGLL